MLVAGKNLWQRRRTFPFLPKASCFLSSSPSFSSLPIRCVFWSDVGEHLQNDGFVSQEQLIRECKFPATSAKSRIVGKYIANGKQGLETSVWDPLILRGHPPQEDLVSFHTEWVGKKKEKKRLENTPQGSGERSLSCVRVVGPFAEQYRSLSSAKWRIGWSGCY